MVPVPGCLSLPKAKAGKLQEALQSFHRVSTRLQSLARRPAKSRSGRWQRTQAWAVARKTPPKASIHMRPAGGWQTGARPTEAEKASESYNPSSNSAWRLEHVPEQLGILEHYGMAPKFHLWLGQRWGPRNSGPEDQGRESRASAAKGTVPPNLVLSTLDKFEVPQSNFIFLLVNHDQR